MRCTRALSSTIARIAALEKSGASSAEENGDAMANPSMAGAHTKDERALRQSPPCGAAIAPGTGRGYLKGDIRPVRQRSFLMAMTMTGEVDLAAPRQKVWEKLNDPDVLKACIPGCQELNKISDTEFQAVAKNKIGPVSATFKGTVTLSDLDPPNGYRISGQGDGGVAGFAKGGATVALSDKDGGTLLTYTVEAQIGGKLAQLGQRLVNGAAKKLADEFFERFAESVKAG
jgi:carbon monoxide dehydrogenase subunit G